MCRTRGSLACVLTLNLTTCRWDIFLSILFFLVQHRVVVVSCECTGKHPQLLSPIGWARSSSPHWSPSPWRHRRKLSLACLCRAVCHGRCCWLSATHSPDQTHTWTTLEHWLCDLNIKSAFADLNTSILFQNNSSIKPVSSQCFRWHHFSQWPVQHYERYGAEFKWNMLSLLLPSLPLQNSCQTCISSTRAHIFFWGNFCWFSDLYS